MRGGGATLLLIVILLATNAVPGDATTAANGDGVPQAGIDTERVVVNIELQTDGSAVWTVEHRVRLDDPNATQGFERVQRQLEQNRSKRLRPFEKSVRAMATRAQERTGREMVIENVSVEASREQIPQEYGVVTFQFRWYGFAETGETLQVRNMLPFLDSSTALIVTWPEETRLAEVSPEPDQRRAQSAVWNGPKEFGQGEPEIVLESDATEFGPNLTWAVQSNDSLVVFGAGGLLITTVGAGIAGIVRRLRGGTDKTEAPEESTDTAESPPSDGETTTAAGTPPEELLSNEERVLKLVDERGGRVKQQAVGNEFGWSATKTSEVVNQLREADEIEVYRLGRENVLALPDVGIGIDSEGEDGGEDG